LIDLASARVGGRVLRANDEFFAPKSNLLKPGAPVFVEGKYTDRGKWMDGWETRRKRVPGYDWCIIRLGIPGVIRGVTIDTTHFTGNYPESCSLAAASGTDGPWREILPRSPLQGHTQNEFDVLPTVARFTRVRLNIYPDGGVARLRVWGEARPDWKRLAVTRRLIDLIAIQHGGIPLASSDEFYGRPLNLIMPDRPAGMKDGWETRRRRGPGHDWATFRLGHRGIIERVVVDTTHFKGNYPESCSLEGADGPPRENTAWREIMPQVKLSANRRHLFRLAKSRHTEASYVRLHMYPDGGIARLRLLGRLAEPV
jgi:allantoicase